MDLCVFHPTVAAVERCEICNRALCGLCLWYAEDGRLFATIGIGISAFLLLLLFAFIALYLVFFVLILLTAA
jgi:hypothetical protein